MANQWVNLHSHLHTSLLDGLSKPEEYVQRAAELGQPAACVTDHGNVAGWIDLYDACEKNGIKFIPGIEAYCARKSRHDRDEEERAGRTDNELTQRGPYHLTLLARNLQGYKNLIKLSSLAFTDGFYVKPRIDHDLLAQFSEGITILSGCLSGEIAQAFLRGDDRVAREAAGFFQDIVGPDNFFIELMDHDIPEERQIRPQLLDLASSCNAKLVPTGDSHYLFEGQSHVHSLLLCISTGSTVQDENRFQFNGEGFHLASYNEMLKKFNPEWLNNTLEVAESIDIKLEFGNLYFPEFQPPEGETIDSYLRKLVEEGIQYRYGTPSEEIRNRIEYELRVIKDSGFQEYFLVVWDIIRWTRENKIRTGGGRGSAAGSCVSYCLRITNVDPIHFGLLFERFLIPGRKSPPDIDIDIDDRYRDRVLKYVRDKYGHDHVANIGTYYSIGSKKAVRDVARVLGHEYSVGDKLAKLVPPPLHGVGRTIKESLETKDFRNVYETDPIAKEIIDAAQGLEGTYRQPGMHAGGLVISRGPITDYVPIMQRYPKGVPGPFTTQWTMDGVERCGLPKIDFLGLTNLSIIDITLEHIRNRHNIELDTDDIPLDNQETFSSLSAGHSSGVFQVEGAGITERMVALHPEKVEDLTDLIALYRPGPMGTGMDRMYISRKHGRSPVKYDHPKLESILDETQGLMVYQEEILSIARELAGFTAGEADDLRKVIGKKLIDKIGLFEDKFVEGCGTTSDISSTIAKKVYGDIKHCAGYGFSRVHGLPYSLLTYYTAYLKTHYPTEYMAALLSSVDTERMGAYLRECSRLGIVVRSPSINKSDKDFKILSENEILFGLGSIKGIGPAIISNIIDTRTGTDKSIFEFMRNIHPEVLNKSTLERLLRSGAFDELADEMPERLLSKDEKLAILQQEKDGLGLYVTEHPLVNIMRYLEPHADCTVDGLETKSSGDRVKVGGLLSGVIYKTTKRGQKMYILTLEDLTGSIEILVFPNAADKVSFSEGDFVVIEGRVQKEEEDEYTVAKLFYSSYIKPEIPRYETGEPIILKFSNPPSDATIKRLESLIESTPGDSPVYIEYYQDNITLNVKFKMPTNKTIQKDLERITLVSQGQ